MRRYLVVGLAVLVVSSVGWACPADAGGPWQAQIVDAETGKPLEGVVVLLSWSKNIRTPGGSSGSYWDAEEIVTGPDGRFKARSRRTFTFNPLAYIEGPEVTIFKPGYGDYRVKDWNKKSREWEELSAGELLEKDDIVLELQRLKTREDRLKFYGRLVWGGAGVPAHKIRHMQEAIRTERTYLGLSN